MESITFGKNKKNVPVYLRTALVQDGKVFMPVAIFENETSAFLKCAYDGTGFINFKKHMYVSISWLIENYPEAKKLILNAEKETLAVWNNEAD
jgi:hypothetical protein